MPGLVDEARLFRVGQIVDRAHAGRVPIGEGVRRQVGPVLADVDRPRIAAGGHAHLEQRRQRTHVAEWPVARYRVVRRTPAPCRHVTALQRRDAIERARQRLRRLPRAPDCAAPERARLRVAHHRFHAGAERALAVQGIELRLAELGQDQPAGQLVGPHGEDQRGRIVGAHRAVEILELRQIDFHRRIGYFVRAMGSFEEPARDLALICAALKI